MQYVILIHKCFCFIAGILCYVVCCADRGFLYTCGDGLHGKLALGDDNIVNHFKPALVTRFAQFVVELVRFYCFLTATLNLLNFCCSSQ